MSCWKNLSAAAAAATALLLFPGVCHGQELVVETCEDLQAAFELTKAQDVEVEIPRFTDIECATYTNMTMSSNTLTVTSPSGYVNPDTTDLIRVRFEVTNGAKLFWESTARFQGIEEEDEYDNDGGAVYVGEGSTVRFLNDLEMTDVGIISERTEGTDYSSYVRRGGCVWTNGYFRVDGAATFTRCENVGGGESYPGPGGAVYVGEEGSVLFNKGVAISEISISDDGGGVGGGICNFGKVNIKGSSTFEDLRASYGAAIYNGVNATFNFRNGAKAFFRDLSNRDSEGSALANLGYFKFAGPALFVDAETPVIAAADSSETILSEDSVFWELEDSVYETQVLTLYDQAEITIPDSVTFIGYEDDEVSV